MTENFTLMQVGICLFHEVCLRIVSASDRSGALMFFNAVVCHVCVCVSLSLSLSLSVCLCVCLCILFEKYPTYAYKCNRYTYGPVFVNSCMHVCMQAFKYVARFTHASKPCLALTCLAADMLTSGRMLSASCIFVHVSCACMY